MRAPKRASHVAMALAVAGALAVTGCSPSQGSETDSGSSAADPQGSGSGSDASEVATAEPGETSTDARVEESTVEGHLTATTVTTVGKTDEVRFEFTDGNLPGYDVRYVPALMLHEDEVLAIEGSAVLSMTLTSTTARDTGAQLPQEVITNESFRLPSVRQVLLADNVGGTMTFGVGVTQQTPFSIRVEDHAIVVVIEHP